MEQKTHGGKRENAGAKTRRGDGQKRIGTGVTLDPEHFEELKDLPRSDVIDLGLGIALPAFKGNADEAREKLETFLNQTK